jgi:hypothetical protein
MDPVSIHAVIVGRLSEIHTDYILVGKAGAQISLPPGFSVTHLREGMNVTVVTTRKDGDVVAERIWKSPMEEFSI